ncbi:hypothetical protein, partial [Vibrio cidicii]|uniref:hypothetical protein n=1 Tax=Vibrio cidicii TaxID=1763883 RepID=UPI003703FB6D
VLQLRVPVGSSTHARVYRGICRYRIVGSIIRVLRRVGQRPCLWRYAYSPQEIGYVITAKHTIDD